VSTLAAPEVSSLDRVPPQNIEAEQAVLGSMLLNEDALVMATELITEGAFYRDSHRRIFAAMVELYRRDVAVDLVTLTDELTRRNALDAVGGPSYLTTLVGIVPTAANIEHYCQIVKAKATLRSLIRASTAITTECYEDVGDPAQLLDKAEQRIFEIAEDRVRRDAVPVKEIVRDQIEVIDALYQNKGVITGVPTGYKDLDNMLAGMHPAELIIVAGRPAMGKSSFAMGLAENAAMMYKKPVAVFSLEMSKESLVQRMLCSHGRIDAHKVRTGMLAANEWKYLTDAASKLTEAPIFIDDTPGLRVLELRARARRLKTRADLGLVILDYLQLMEEPGYGDNRQQEIATISRSLKALARELDLPVIAVSQLSRAPERRDSFRPRLSDLRESGAIEQDADVVLLLYRDDYYNQNSEERGVAEVIIAKQRNGPTGTVKLTFIKEYTRFESLAHN
jgi:replicative DNA helicase